MNRKLFTVSIILLLGLSACTFTVTTDGGDQPTPSISVTGEGFADVRPDQAMVQIGVQTRDKDAGRAVQANNEQARAVIDAIQALGIADADVLTSNFSVFAQEEFDKETGQPTGELTYVVDNLVVVTIRDLTQVGPSLDAATGAGANSIRGVTFTVEDRAAALNEARAKAMTDARARAEQIARGTGVELGSVISLTESEYGDPIPLAEAVALRGLAAEAPAAAPVSSGTFRVQLQVSVTYEIK